MKRQKSNADMKPNTVASPKKVGASMARLLTTDEVAVVAGAYSGPSHRGAGH